MRFILEIFYVLPTIKAVTKMLYVERKMLQKYSENYG